MAGHHHAHGSAGRRALTVALVLIVGLMAGEVVFGVAAGSLALLADAGHMLTDAAALGLALAAAAYAGRPARGRWTFGFRRLEILAAHVNGITLLVVGVLIVYTAVRRLVSPPEVRGGLVLVVALAGMVVNLIAALVLAGPSRESLNVRGAFLHVTTDLAAFTGTAVAGAVILATGWDQADPIASLVVAALIFWSSYSLLRESTRILLDVAPESPARSPTRCSRCPGSSRCTTCTSGRSGAGSRRSPHTCSSSRARTATRCAANWPALLDERFSLAHSTLQVEHAASAATASQLPLAAPRRLRI